MSIQKHIEADYRNQKKKVKSTAKKVEEVVEEKVDEVVEEKPTRRRRGRKKK